ncbi:MAG: hypothetical protein EXS36_13255 [Pedosphaera sp.]|nr:hypothetical protein [Pedosphaera sp.]
MKTQILIAVIALQTAWVVGTVAIQEVRLHRGTLVLLETVPVDPRDLLRGDYVILRYKISTLSGSLFAGGLTNEAPAGTSIYVKLEKRGAFHEAQEASLTPLTGDAQHPVLHGNVASRSRWDTGNNTNRLALVDYGLERFYVREGTGNPRGKLTTEVAVPASGKGVIHQVFLDGKPYAEAMKNEAR